jgi:hypothetical protein
MDAASSGEWLKAAKRARQEQRERMKPRDQLWNDSDDNGKETRQTRQQPNYPYHEVVRCKAQRQNLPCHDCYSCRKFYAALDPQDALELLQHSRHRAQFSPSETPQDFWVVDFIDEIEKEREAEQAAAASSKEPEHAKAASSKEAGPTKD